MWAEHACAFADVNGHQLAAWVRASERDAGFFQEGVEAAWAALDAARVRTWAYVLADGMRDESKIGHRPACDPNVP